MSALKQNTVEGKTKHKYFSLKDFKILLERGRGEYKFGVVLVKSNVLKT